MNLDKMADLTEGFGTKADKMRVLERAGYARADIARFLGVRYQQVRNTLEGDKRTGYSPRLIPDRNGHESGPPPIDGEDPFRRIDVGEDGLAMLPSDLIEPFVDNEGNWLVAIAVEHGIFVSSLEGMGARVRASFR